MRRAAGATGGLRSLERRLISGFSAQGLSFGARIFEQILLVPLFISAWGTALYQDWLLLFAAAGFLALADVGMQTYFGNLMVQAWARSDPNGCNHVIALALGAYTIVCGLTFVLATAVFLAVDWPDRLNITMLPHDEARWTLAWLGLSFLCLVPRGITTQIYRARGDFGRAINLTTLLVVARAGAIALTLALGAPPRVVALVDVLIVLVIGWGLVLFDQKWRYSDLRYGLRLPDRNETSDLIDKTRWYFLPQLSAILLLHAPVLIIGLLVPVPGAVVAFTVARTLTGVLRQIPLRLSDVTGVEMASYHAQDEPALMRRLYMHTGRLAGGVSGLLAGLILALGEPLITIWTRGAVAYDPWLIAFFVLPMFLTAPANTSVVALHYTNQPGPIAFARSAHTVLGLALGALLVPRFASPGAAAGLAVGEILALGGYLTFVATRRLGIDVGTYLRSSLSGATLMLLISYGSAALGGAWIEPRGARELLLLGLLWAAVILLPTLVLMTPAQQRRLLLARVSTWLASRR
jgi:O-antigen/teichoic acid export membrane protein